MEVTRIMKKYLSCILALCFAMSGVVSTYAEVREYQNIERQEVYSFSENFNGYAEAEFTGSGTSMNQNWRTSATGENEEELNTMTRKFDGSTLKVAKNAGDVTQKYTTMRQTRFPAVVFKGERTNLTKDQLIKVSAQKDSVSDMWGIRFYVHSGVDNTLNYYTLYFGGMHTYATSGGYLTYGLYKSTDGVVSTLKEKVRTVNEADDVNGYMGCGKANLTISIVDGLITWNLDYVHGETTYRYTDSYQDTVMFDAAGKDTTVHLYAGGGSAGYVAFDDFSIASNIPYITASEPENVIYYDVADGKEKNDGIIDLGQDVRIRKILYSGETSNENVLVSKDGETWYLFTDLSKFTDGKFLNNITNDYFRYVYAGSAANNLTVLTDISALKGVYTDKDIRVYPRVGGQDYFSESNNILTTDNDQVVKINGNYISSAGIGSANVTASAEGKSVSVAVTYTNGTYSYEDSFDNCGTVTKVGSNVQFDDEWRSKTVAEGKMGYNDAATFGYNNNRLFVQARGLMDGDSFSRYPRWAETVPAVVFNADHSELEQNQVIKAKILKTSGTETAGIRFMVHDNGNSYYALLFPGMYALGGLTDKDGYASSWELIKCEGGQYTMLAKHERASGASADTEDGYLSFGTGDLTIEYVDGKISWKMPVYKNSTKLYEWSCEYQDDSPYLLSGNDSTVWLMSGLYSGNDTTRGVYYDDVEISSYVPYITSNEPDAVVYMDMVENKNNADGIYTLDKETNIRRIVAGEVTGTLKVFGSTDGQKWYSICNFEEDGEFLNNIYADKFGYIKTEGKGEIRLLSEIPDNKIRLMPEESMTVYLYINGTLSEATIQEGTGCVAVEGSKITGKSAIKNDKLTINCGTENQVLYVTVPLIDAMHEVIPKNSGAEISLTANEISDVSAKIVVLFFNSDHSMSSMESYNAEFDDGVETIYVEDFYNKGDYAKILVWKDEDSTIPYTKAIKINLN